jgi:hypothetical protein
VFEGVIRRHSNPKNGISGEDAYIPVITFPHNSNKVPFFLGLLSHKDGLHFARKLFLFGVKMARWNGGPGIFPPLGKYMFRLKDSGGLKRAGKRVGSNILPLWPVLFGIFVGLVSGGCSSGPTESSFGFLDAQGNHPAGWVTSHPAFALPDGRACTDCHGSVTDEAQSGGIANISCFTASRNGVGCHANGPTFQSLNGLNKAGGNFHGTAFTDNEPFPTVWANPDAHGPSAKSAPGVASGFAFCQTCHGDDFGGTGNVPSCLNNAFCHGSEVVSPHSPSPWRLSARTHTNTDTGNAEVCALCHLGGGSVVTTSPSPVPAGVTPGCFNNTLCHGEDHGSENW